MSVAADWRVRDARRSTRSIVFVVCYTENLLILSKLPETPETLKNPQTFMILRYKEAKFEYIYVKTFHQFKF